MHTRDAGLAPGAELTVELTVPAYGGDTLGRLPDGRVVLVPYALPGERLKVRLTELRRGYARAVPLELLEASPLRRPPRCRHFGLCGGCHYQHLDYDRQLEIKRQLLAEQLARIGGLAAPAVEPAVPSPSPWNYRNHVQFHLTADGSPGFREARSHRVVPLAECHLPEAPLGALWPRLRRPGAQRLILRTDSDGRCLAIPETGPSDVRELRMEVLGESFRLSPLSFFQVNTAGAARLVRQVLECCGEAPARHALELYCGAGLFTRFLAPRAERLTAVEVSASACGDFRVNLADKENVRLVEGEAAAALEGFGDPVDLVVADPPRAGLGPKVAGLLSRPRPRRLVYVSCDPATLARDAALLAGRGWRLRRVVPVDMFPQTAHIESVSLWE
ncbi:MAG: class I SAM-dependent RNA methyltransferase [Spirochaetales bacterium]|nr:class I SAM-dependent RNA methyltransferase [Spirochaetales bacterium]